MSHPPIHARLTYRHNHVPIYSYILKQPAVDMCGVIKSVDFSDGQTTAAYHGNARLGPTGAATVFLPRHFREVRD